MLTLHHAPLTGGFSHLEFDVAVKRLRIYDQQEAIRLAKAGMLRWTGKRGDSFPYMITTEEDVAVTLAIDMWWDNQACFIPHILVDEEDE